MGLTNGGTKLTWQKRRLSIIDSQHFLSEFLAILIQLVPMIYPPAIFLLDQFL